MPFAIATAAVGIGSAVLSSNASKTAAQDQENSAENATNAQLSMFNTTQGDYANQIKLGAGASTLLQDLYDTNGNGKPNYSSFNNSPGYQFSVQQGQAAITKAAAASGGLYSTNTLGALSAFNTGQASTQYNSYVNQLLSMSGLGNAAASGVGSAATATGGEIGANANLAGSAAAAGTLGSANAFTNALGSNNGIGSLLNNYSGAGANSNPYNLGGSTPVGEGGSLQYDQWGNIIGGGSAGGGDLASANAGGFGG